MQLSVIWSPVAQILWSLVMLVGMSGCEKDSVAGDGELAAVAGDAKAGYVLRTQMRPEVPAKYFAAERGFYQACVALANGMNVQVKPFTEVPEDFVAERHTYASDGKRSSHSDIRYFLDTRKMNPQSGCEVRLVSKWRTSVTSDGQERQAARDEDGHVEVSEPQPAPDDRVRASMLTSRTVSKRIGGVPLKCDAGDTCIVDPEVVVITEGARPVQAAYRDNSVSTYGTALLVEPVSLSLGAPADPTLFSLEAGK